MSGILNRVLTCTFCACALIAVIVGASGVHVSRFTAIVWPLLAGAYFVLYQVERRRPR